MENTESGLEKLTDSLEHAITGIPAPLRKNFFKAFGQLCTAAVDIPVAFLESKAAEIRATTTARVQIIKKEGDTISEKIDVPMEYISKASSKYASKIIKEQLNLDEVTLNAARELSSSNIEEENSKTPENEIDDDWLNEFESHARVKSSEDMKLIFGKILSGEISKPGTFSIRTLRLVSQLDNQAAKLFQLLCSQSVSINFETLIFDARVVSFSGSASSNSISQFGLSFDNLNVLQEYGLIISDYNSSMTYAPCIANESNTISVFITYNNRRYGLVPIDKEKYDKKLSLNGVAFTKAGKELLSIIPLQESENYTKALNKYLEGKFLKMVEAKTL